MVADTLQPEKSKRNAAYAAAASMKDRFFEFFMKICLKAEEMAKKMAKEMTKEMIQEMGARS